MLKQFLSLKQTQLDGMLRRKSQLEDALSLESSRVTQLNNYRDMLSVVETTTSSVTLTNQSQMVGVISNMQAEQNAKVNEAKSDLSRHAQACLKQASFNLGIEKLVDKQQREKLHKERTLERKQVDEISAIMFSRRR